MFIVLQTDADISSTSTDGSDEDTKVEKASGGAHCKKKKQQSSDQKVPFIEL